MFNISDKTVIENLDLIRSRGYLAQCIVDKNLHKSPHYTYFGKRVQRGNVDLHCADGDIRVTFVVEKGWAKSLKLDPITARTHATPGKWEETSGAEYRAKHKKDYYKQLVLYFKKDGELTRESVQARAAELGMTGAQYVTSLIKKDMGIE